MFRAIVLVLAGSLACKSNDAFLAGAEQMEAADALLPEEFWVGKHQLNPGADGIADVELEGIAAGAEATDGFIARFSHQVGYTDWSTCAEAWLSDPIR